MTLPSSKPETPNATLTDLIERWLETAERLTSLAAEQRARSSVGLAQPNEQDAQRLRKCAEELRAALGSTEDERALFERLKAKYESAGMI